MKLKKICTLAIVAMFIVTGCKANNEVVQDIDSNDTGGTLSELINTTETGKEENPNYTNNQIYFDMYKEDIKLDEIKRKYSSNEEVDTLYIYEPDIVNGTDEIFKSGKKLIASAFSMEEKLIILCDYLENELGDINIRLKTNVDDKFAVVIAVEKYGQSGGDSDYRRGVIFNTLNQIDSNEGWFEHVDVIYDSGAFGDR